MARFAKSSRTSLRDRQSLLRMNVLHLAGGVVRASVLFEGILNVTGGLTSKYFGEYSCGLVFFGRVERGT